MSARALAGAVALALAAAPAAADDSNFRPYVIGGRAGGMGGAFTALADDGSGPYYNPAGIAFVEKSQLSLAASVYGLVAGRQEGALGAGADFTYSALNVFPVSTSTVLKFGAGETPNAPGRNAVALCVFVPDALRIDDRTSLGGASQNAVFVSREEQTIWVGGAFARRFGRVGLGAGGFVLIGTQTSFADLTAIPGGQGLPATSFAIVTARTDLSTLGVVGTLGVRWDVTDAFRLGLSVFSPQLGLSGSRRFFRRTVAAPVDTPPLPAGIVPEIRDGLHASPTLPYRVQAGVAWTSGKLTLAADAIYLGRREVDDDAADPTVRRHIVRNAVVNGAVGGEYVLGESFPLRAGFFTDFAASPPPVAGPIATSPNVENTTHYDRYGGTLSIGYHTEHTATDLGLIFSYGSGTDLQVDFNDTTRLATTRATQTLLYVFLSTAYRF